MSAAELRYMIATDSLGGEGVRLTDIANKMGVTKVSVYRMSERLTEMGFMTRCAQSRIALTEKGKKFSAEKIMPLHEIENKIWNEWTAEEQQQYLTLTKKYRDGLKKYLEAML